MSRPPLRLDRYFFTKTSVEVNDKYGHSDEENKHRQRDMALGLGIEFGKNETNEKNYRIEVHIKDIKSENGQLPYLIEVKVIGWFTVDDEFSHPDIDRLVHVNGASMLFGAAREHVLAITGRGPHGPFQLPTIHLAGKLPKELSNTNTDGDQV